MIKKVWLLMVAVVFIFSLNGCASLCKKNNSELQGLRDKVSALESQLSEKDNEISSLRESTLRSSGEINLAANQAEVKQQIDPKQIQAALKNAGYYQGAVDGKLGKKTRRAVREFQKANNLPIDGKVGNKTWSILKDYLEKRVK